MREATESVYPQFVDPLIFYQDADIERYPFLNRYYELLRANDFDAAKTYIQSLDVDYYGAWLLNTIEKRLHATQENIDYWVGEKPKLVIHKALEPAHSEFTDECRCWTGDLGKIVTDVFWHPNLNTNPMHAVDGTAFYFERYSPTDPYYTEGMYALKPTHVERRGPTSSTYGTTNDPGISVFEVQSLRNQSLWFPLYDSLGSEADEHIRISLVADNPSLEYGHVTLKASLYQNSTEIETSENYYITGSSTVSSDNHFYLFSGVDTIYGDIQGNTTISNVFYFGLIQSYLSGSQRCYDFGGVGLDLLNIQNTYGVTVHPEDGPNDPTP